MVSPIIAAGAKIAASLFVLVAVFAASTAVGYWIASRYGRTPRHRRAIFTAFGSGGLVGAALVTTLVLRRIVL